MNKQLHILIVGDPGQVVSELNISNIDDLCFSYCSADDFARELFNSYQSYDWVLFNEKSLHGAQLEMVRALRMLGFFLPDEDKRNTGQSRCQLEWTEEGVLQLRCCMQAHTRKQSSMECQCDNAFEYHAPMKTNR